MTGTREVPFYDRDGAHWMTLEMGVDERGEPPEAVQLLGPEAGRAVQCEFSREHRPGEDPPWAYVEINRTWRGEPTPGSQEALRRVLDSHDWPSLT
ncbi:MAG: hypothetical protein QOC67_3023 [Pseudonocardiales bacterium]|nr:hypothetical protein [Pseudonocardiales bacterium]MDT7696663.1 hypothetical protein [Pseudonocardiales bacterium]MDT7774099.1 hypothetical protein [Pseudonocardiales bacterium]